MKKTIIALMALGGVASAATELLYWGGSNGKNLLSVESGYTPYLSVGEHRAPESIISTISTVGDVTYDLIFDPFRDSRVATPSFTIDKAVYFNSLDVKGETKPTSFTIDFGTQGSIITAQNINFGASVNKFSFSATLTDAQIEELTTGATVTRTLLTGNGNWGIWNFGDKANDAGNKTLSLEGLSSEYKFIGQITDVSILQEGEYGIVWSDSTSKDTVSFAVRGITVPEPTTATLSLLALAGLAARRRRR